jgi:hypothetical protein
MRSFARFFAETMNHLSPVTIFQMEQATKSAAEVGGAFRGMPAINSAFNQTRSAYAAGGRRFGADFWAGHDLERMGGLMRDPAGMESLMKDPVYTKSMQRRSFYRKAAITALAAGTVGKAVMGNNLITDAGDAMLGAGIGFGVAGAAFHAGYSRPSVAARILGWGATGITARNMLSSGDDWGPF